MMNSIKALLIIGLACHGSFLACQNLVPNPGFEDHQEFEQGFSPFYWGISHLNQWVESGSLGMLSYCFVDLEKRTDTFFKKTSCCGNTINPHLGKGMVKLSYHESCGLEEPLGCASYIRTKFISPLVVGNIYEVSMWVYFPENQSEDTTIYTNIGMYLSLQPENIYVHSLLQTDYFFSNTIQVGRWYQIKNYIRAFFSRSSKKSLSPTIPPWLKLKL